MAWHRFPQKLQPRLFRSKSWIHTEMALYLRTKEETALVFPYPDPAVTVTRGLRTAFASKS
jgi:hypothetical protein